MQNLESMKENTNPDNFLGTNTSSNNSNIDGNTAPNTTTSTGATRPKFSFASNYTPLQHYSGSSASYDRGTNPQLPAPSFAVLNSNYVASASSLRNKPNAIVHPIRRVDPNAYNGLEQELRVTGFNPSLAITYPQLGDSHHFAEELNRKLCHLSSIQGDSQNFKSSLHHGSNQDTLNQRPLFITTVPRGIFLPPPKEIILLSPTRKRQLYAYSSHPVVYNTTSSHYNNTHNGHKTKVTSESNYSHRNTLAMAKDKHRSNNDCAGGAGGGDGGEALITNDGGANAIVVYDKTTPITKSSSQLNGARGSYGAATPLPGGLHITKQQFQQQLQQTRSKRETPPSEAFKNVMYDKRVVRGSNFGANQLLGEYDPFDRAAELRRRQVLRKKNITQRNQRNILGTPPPVKGRKHEDVQTDKYLEELATRPAEASTETQTDLFLEKPPTPPYIPAKVGIDVATEIADGELFQFDVEVQPVIDTMVDSILEMSILEVAHEQEIFDIRKKQQQLLAEREKELAELRRLEEEEVRLQAEKERRLRQDKISKSLDDEMQKEVTAAKLLQGHIAGILPEVLDSLEPATDAAKKEELMKNIYPWLSAEVAEEVGQIVDSREILTVIIQEIIKQRAETYAGYQEQMPPKQVPSAVEMQEAEEEPYQSTTPPDLT